MGMTLQLASRTLRTKMDTLLLTQDEVAQWRIPPCQRLLRVNAKVRALALKLGTDGVLPGIIILGYVGNDTKTVWIVDGQHRLKAFAMSELAEILADVQIVYFDKIEDISERFVGAQEHLVAMRPDDTLRAYEGSIKSLAYMRQCCNFVGYDNIRRGGTSAILSMSAVLRCWVGSEGETPVAMTKKAGDIAKEFGMTSAEKLVAFLNIARDAWGNDPEYYKLWGNLNLSLCMWLFRTLVLEPRSANKRHVTLSLDQFKKCLMFISTKREYIDWLYGRSLTDRDRSPAYGRLKNIFSTRLRQDSKEGKKPIMPSPAWSATR